MGSVWYKDPGKFHVLNDGKSWLGMDKAGHAFSAYHINKQVYRLYNWAGYEDKEALILSGSVALLFQSSFELLDGFQKSYGFSWADMAANASGVVLYSSQIALWQEERIRLKFSYSPSPYAATRPEVLGYNFPERLLKDYNAQSYWLSFSPFGFTANKQFSWLQLSLGYSVNEKLVGTENTYTYNGVTYQAYSQFLMSLDIDFTQMEIKNKTLKSILTVFNTLKVPFPTLAITPQGMRFHPIYF